MDAYDYKLETEISIVGGLCAVIGLFALDYVHP